MRRKMISIKSKSDIEKMLEAGKIAAEALNTVEAKLRPGMTTKDIDKIVHQVITSHSATPNFLGLYGFPASACVSVNEEVIHGIPGNRRLNEGDIVSVDLGACYKGWNSGCATHLFKSSGNLCTWPIGIITVFTINEVVMFFPCCTTIRDVIHIVITTSG